MARQDAESTYKAIRREMMGLLRERIQDPTLPLDLVATPNASNRVVAGRQLMNAGHLDGTGRITLAGMEYYRKQTRPIWTWILSNWFVVIVALMTTTATAFAGVSNFLIGNGPC